MGPASACANADLAKFLNAGYSLELRYSFLEICRDCGRAAARGIMQALN
jgi:hypothetical protein